MTNIEILNEAPVTEADAQLKRDIYMSEIDWEQRGHINAYGEDDLWRANALAFSELNDATYTHSLRVASQREFNAGHPDTRTLRAVALLHDVLEDGRSRLTLADLTDKGFSDKVVEAVDLLTRVGDSGDQTYAEYLHRLSRNGIARTVKIADLRDNLYGRSKPPNESLATRYRKALRLLSDRQEKVEVRS